MKKFLLGIGLIFCSLVAQAQRAQEISRPVSVGPRIGGIMSDIWNEQEDISSSIFGANVGVVSNIRFTKKQAIQAELMYAGKGFIQESYDMKHSLHYIEIPFLYQRYFFANKKGGHLAEKRRSGNIFIFGGPQVSILMKSTGKYQNPEMGAETVDMYTITRPFDMSAVAGLGYAMKNGFSIDARYALGFRHLHAGSVSAYMPQDITNTAVQVGVTYLIPVKVN